MRTEFFIDPDKISEEIVLALYKQAAGRAREFPLKFTLFQRNTNINWLLNNWQSCILILFNTLTLAFTTSTINIQQITRKCVGRSL